MGSFAVLPGEVSSAFDVTYVDDDAGYVDGDGDDYFSEIWAALNNTSAGGTVYVAAGTYSLSNYSIDENVQLIGEDPATTIIDNGGTSRYLYIYGVDASTLIEGFTFANGSYPDNGGAISIRNAAPTINNCIFTENTSDFGGAIDADASFPTISHCTFDTNQAIKTGGAIYCTDSDLTLFACEFIENEAAYSGAVHSGEDGSADVDRCLFKENVAEPTISGEASVAGALRLDENTDSSVTNSRFVDNSADMRGGGLYVSNSQGTVVTNCVFNGNSATLGGAMFNRDSSSAVVVSPVVTNCTFYDNYASSSGGVMYSGVSPDEGISVTMTNCIIWNNSTPIIDSTGEGTFICNVAYSNVQGGRPGAGNIDTDPLFIDPASDLSLQASSPCVDTGTDASAAVYGSVVSDIEGVLRPQGSEYDMGAYEFYVATDDPWSPVSIMPLMRTQLSSVGDAWNVLSETLPDEPDEEVTRLIERIQEHMQNATGLANPVYASGELARALELMIELSKLLES